jgi:ornithine--oxo-acid transaminase
MAKALSGGFVPIGAVLVSRAAFDRVFDGMERAVRHGSTFGGNDLAAAAALATLRVIDRDGVVAHADRMGKLLLELTTPLIERHDVVRDVRGLGLMWAIELGPPAAGGSRALFNAVERAQPGLFAQLITVPLFHDHQILCQVAGHRMNVVKALPSLLIDEDEVRRFADALADVVAASERVPRAMARFGMRMARGTARSRRPRRATARRATG